MSSLELYIERDLPLATIVFNRPHARNAVTQAMWGAMPELLAQLAADAGVRVVIVRGVDHAAFAAGADIAEFESVYGTAESAAASSAVIDAALAALEALPKPTIAMIRGVCVGGGVSIATACDLRMADVNARFAVTPAKLGLIYSLADTRRLAATVGVSCAKDLLFSGRMMDAQAALSAGLIDRMEPLEALAEAVRSYALSVASLAPGSHAATKQIMRMLVNGDPDDSADARQAFLQRFDSADFHEGYAAFLQKRAARF